MLNEVTLTIALINFASTWFMVGLIWFVQWIHYPLFPVVGAGEFRAFHRKHMRWTGQIVMVPMGLEAFTALLMIWYPPIDNAPLVLLAAGLVLFIWITTVFAQVPAHGELRRGFQPGAQLRLVLTNWLRTVAWTLRGALVWWFLYSAVANAILEPV